MAQFMKAAGCVTSEVNDAEGETEEALAEGDNLVGTVRACKSHSILIYTA